MPIFIVFKLPVRPGKPTLTWYLGIAMRLWVCPEQNKFFSLSKITFRLSHYLSKIEAAAAVKLQTTG
ncbi:hypothetical protein G7B40_031845 [Aetokthonos hydrillicola Thurmond2011]|jgi:hypothetical protein|uniref:Uncharacterized protein n=1 Tax=Aetokthonos hydrillicola Thurmond2011 TaxID=2712845 RepID=A0AAP5MBD0_9CYAN|nr:hypothetical protein [Aetokthonos hydrillicola CCALA 1050]MBW4589626.1 hypothetical protein [Aetokthonos hydrillicola CCALA 1050]MDR9899120.1 hypothetical protein [Aetokthonos hydrillicola Thurmond2011]